MFWVCQKPKELAQKFTQIHQLSVSHGTVKNLLLKMCAPTSLYWVGFRQWSIVNEVECIEWIKGL